MKIHIKAYALSDHLPSLCAGKTLTLDAGTTIEMVLRQFDLPAQVGRLLHFVNGRPRPLQHVLEEGDELILLRPLEGG